MHLFLNAVAVNERFVRRIDSFLHQSFVNTRKSVISFPEHLNGLMNVVVRWRPTSQRLPIFQVRAMSPYVVVPEFENFSGSPSKKLDSHTVLVEAIGRNPA